MNDGKSERYANDKGSYRKLFEVSAAAIKKGKSVLMQTVNGYRKFFLPSAELSMQESILLMADVNGLNAHLMMVTQEFNALLSIERPVVRVSTKSDELKALYGSTTLVKCPDDGMTMLIIDDMERFDATETARLNVLEGEAFESGHQNERRFPQWKGSMMSVLAEHGAGGEKAIGVHFDSALYFLYYNGKEVINAVPPNPFEADHLFEHIGDLREGSDRLIVNYRKAYPEICERLDTLSGDVDIFTVTAIMLGLKEESFEGISAEALSFLGKGGIQIDTRVDNNRFDNYAFLASIMSYQLGTVENALMCYSIYESFGDYIAEVVSQLLEKSKAKNVTLTGETLANQALYARIQRHMGMRNLLFPVNYPIGRECAVHGGIFFSEE